MLGFNLKYGDNVEKIIRSALEEGDEIPESIRNAPQLHKDNVFYWNCFSDLGSDRTMNFGGLGRIPWTSVKSYCDLYKLSPQATLMIFDIIKKLDNYYLDFLDKQNKSKMKKDKKR